MNIRELAVAIREDSLRLCEELLPLGKREGPIWRVGDVMGSAGGSMTVELEGEKAGQWFDHAANEGGDLLRLIELNRGLHGVIAASDWARNWKGLPPWKPMLNGHKAPIDGGFDPLKKNWKLKATGEWACPSKSWRYRAEDGTTIAYVCRFDFVKDGKTEKDVVPMRNIDGEWRWKGWTKDEKRPTYGLEFLKLNDGRPLLIVEGEKTCDAARKLFPNCVCVTWQGGTSAVSKADWSPWKAWTGPIVLWPDNDDPGFGAMLYLRGAFQKARQAKLPKEIPPKWDLADPIPEGVSVKGIIDGALMPEDAKAPVDDDSNKPYVPLGFDERGFYFLSRNEGLVHHLSASSLTELNMFRIAPDEHWQSLGMFKSNSTKVDYNAAAKLVMSECQLKGVFDPTSIRGRGAHEDAGRIIFNMGDHLLVDNVPMGFTELKSNFFYPKRPKIHGIDIDHPLSVKESKKFVEMLSMCSWEKKRSAILLAGSVVCAILCGLLGWRPHVFMQGESSSGKTWILNHIVGPVLKMLCRVFMSCASSEAGVRQAIGIDNISCILEEFDAQKLKTGDALEAISTLARASSSDTGGVGVKGTQEGIARSYSIKACFLFIGTAPAITMKADLSRITFLELQKDQGGNFKDFEKIQSMAQETTERPEWRGQLIASIIRNARPTLASITTFTSIIGRQLRDSRAGDQLGALVGGAWMLENDEAPTKEQAEAYVKALNLDDMAPTESETDQSSCLKSLVSYRIDVEDNGHRRMMTIGDCVRNLLADDIHPDDVLSSKRALAQWGIRLAPLGDGIYVARKHRQVETIFRGTLYAEQYETHLLRIKGSESIESVLIGSVRTKAIIIPQEAFR